jgi:hypothetical protein
MFKLKPQGQQLALAARKTSKECPGAESSNEQSFGSLGAGILTNPEGKYPKGTFFHRTDEGPSGRETPGRRLALRNKIRRLSGTGFQGRQRCAAGLTEQKAFYPQLVNSLKLLPAERVVLDGEIAGFLEAGSAFATDQRLTIIQGKVISITGTIERREGKPEINVVSTDQIKGRILHW